MLRFVKLYPSSVLICHCTVAGPGLPALAAAENEVFCPTPMVWFEGFVVTVGVAEDAEDPVATVEVAVVRALDLRDNPLFAGIEIETVVERAAHKSIGRRLGRHIGPVQVVGPVLGPGRPGSL